MQAEQPNIKKKPGRDDAKRDWRIRLNYEWMVRNLPFILFLASLALIYIANGHYAVKNMRAMNKTNQQLKELRWQYLQVKSDLMYRSKMSEVAKSLAPSGLKELTAPPEKIVADSSQ